jgi:hypothetical protein
MFFFKAKDGTMLYMGKDKYENEDLIKFGWPEDIWFHVDNLSSAHVYARLPEGGTMETLSEDLIRECAQLVKENSIEGCKKTSVTVVYTPWSNLKKTGGMDVGQVSYHVDKLVRKYLVLEKDKETLRRIEKTREERHPDLQAEREQRDEELRARAKAEGKAKAAADKELQEARRKEKDERSYDRLFAKKDEAPASGGGGGKGGGKGKAGKYKDKGLEDDFGAFSIKATEDASAAKRVEEDFM